MIPSQGRIVLYRLNEQDVEEINESRQHVDGSHRPHRRGNPVEAGQVYPAVIVRTWGDTEGSAVNLKVELDGNHSHWATSRSEGTENGTWFVPPKV